MPIPCNVTLTYKINFVKILRNENGIDGFVVVKVKGTWHPYCSNLWSQELGSEICSNLLPNSTLDDVQTFDVGRFDFETVLFVVANFNDEAEHRIVNMTDDDFEGEERFGDASSCEIGYVKCVQFEEESNG
jgi:hypothetical protein